MKRITKILVLTLALCCTIPIPAFASETSFESAETVCEKPVIVRVETTNEDFTKNYIFSSFLFKQARSVIDLSNGLSTFSVGKLGANAMKTTDTYAITKSTIKIDLQSIDGASEHIKVTLYKSNGNSVASATLSLPWTNLASGTAKYVTFSNLDSSKKYYAVIKNIDTVESGNILGIAKQA